MLVYVSLLPLDRYCGSILFKAPACGSRLEFRVLARNEEKLGVHW